MHTVASPNTTRSRYTSLTEYLAQVGFRSVNTDAIAILTPNTRLPPNLSANHPPGICVNMYP